MEHKGSWTIEECQHFIQLIQQFGIGHWKQISQVMQTRTPNQCQIHYFKLKQRLGMTDEQFKFQIKTFEQTQARTSHKPAVIPASSEHLPTFFPFDVANLSQ
ncbi:Myb-like_DNA-binding domain-containing protein [Hexamita inflata]|uniref:Myb-like DNA-binding domain-containing protein n=1 Tax=Hexamita inflata TaxID=28002 RepID=A0AA86R199_9EUKA|nr:Myb-like DNA-binding domain-containing protein [Hexamita inflata]CAI9950424.1 Myb-like DNA-binding domain-containing protein [Hexamita inflata]CAI9960695.1 Myb-like DNA-binding domain-containing protein [Hexamita inflata]